MPKIEQFISLPSGGSFPSLYHGIVEKAKRNPACAEGGGGQVHWPYFIPVHSHRNSVAQNPFQG